MATSEGRVSRLEGAFEQFADRINTLATRDELQGTREELRAEIRASTKESELRVIKWMVGLMIAQAGWMIALAGIAVALLKLLP